MKKYQYYIGIDTGVNTGFAVWDTELQKYQNIYTLKIDEAMEMINVYKYNHVSIFVRFEDARLRKWFADSGREKLQGAGSVKRDAKIWEDFLTRKQIHFESVPPRKNKTKLSAKEFKNITKYEGRTTEHGRDAAMLVFGI